MNMTTKTIYVFRHIKRILKLQLLIEKTAPLKYTWIKRPKEFLINASAIAHSVPATTDGSSGSINKLKTIANTILKKPVKHINPYSCHFIEKSDQSNEEALDNFARKLSDERKRRVD
ncbi:hypothetical protein EZV62_010254 [Acer yangbiense]|uniref:Uncharacterized protein n=1 Tax=Acer yangbiense TaxID=1000413 RepID=A0A5C7I273_9ROSI|nr:hypothetical protein EZV62_010254 [Acer yangbiense]